MGRREHFTVQQSTSLGQIIPPLQNFKPSLSYFTAHQVEINKTCWSGPLITNSCRAVKSELKPLNCWLFKLLWRSQSSQFGSRHSWSYRCSLWVYANIKCEMMIYIRNNMGRIDITALATCPLFFKCLSVCESFFFLADFEDKYEQLP